MSIDLNSIPQHLQEYDPKFPMDQCIIHPKNPRRGNVDAIGASVMENGWYGAIVLQKSTKHIIVGNHRYMVMKHLKAETIPAFIVDVDDQKAFDMLLADNRTAELGDFDAELLVSGLREATSLEAAGYDNDAFEEVMLSAANERFRTERAAGQAVEQEQRPATPSAPTYNLVFSGAEDQARWYGFVRSLKSRYPDKETIGERVLMFLEEAGAL